MYTECIEGLLQWDHPVDNFIQRQRPCEPKVTKRAKEARQF